jgi:hypothetical protein
MVCLYQTQLIPRCTPGYRADSCRKLFKVERFAQIVISAGSLQTNINEV